MRRSRQGLLVCCLSFALVLVARTGIGEDFEKVAPQLPPPTPGDEKVSAREGELSEDEILIPRLKGIVFVSSKSTVRASVPRSRPTLDVQGVPLLQNTSFEERMRRHIGKSFSLKALKELTAEVRRYANSRTRILVRVSLPDQELTGGVLHVLVAEQKAEEIRITGVRWSDPAKLLRQLPFEPGAPIDVTDASSAIHFLNRNPFRRIDVDYLPGTSEHLSAIQLRLQERRPYRVYLSYENDGTERSGLSRWRAGFNTGNLWKAGHQFSYQLTSGNSFSEFHANTAIYTAPLPWRHVATLFGGWVEVGTPVTDSIDNIEDIWLIGLRYVIPLPSLFRIRQDLTVGGDYKQSQRTFLVESPGNPDVEVNTDTELSQFNFGYTARLSDPMGFTRLGLELFYSPGFELPNATSADYQRVRAGAETEYVYLRGRVDRQFDLPKGFTLRGRVTFQVANEPLLPSEQLTLGGYDYVRGFTTSSYNGDIGFRSTIELRSPLLSLPRRAGRLQAIAFFDSAYAERLESVSATFSDATFASFGPGLRYTFREYFSVRADYGFRVEDSNLPGLSNNTLHVGVTLSY